MLPLEWICDRHVIVTFTLLYASIYNIHHTLMDFFLQDLVFFTIRWWNPETLEAMRPEGAAARVTWPYIEDKSYLCTWLFLVPLVVYTLWQVLYYLIVNVLRRQRFLRDPEVMTSYR